MRWKAKYTRADFAPNTTRFKRVFAWIPTYVGGTMVWLETYEVLQVYSVEEIQLEDEGKPVFFTNGNWKDIAKRTIG